MQVVPAGVAPAPGDIVQVAVVLDNPTDSPVAFRGLRFITPPRMTVATPPDLPSELSAGSSYVAVVDVTIAPGAGEADIGVVAEFAGAAGGTVRSATTNLAVTPATDAAAPEASFLVFPSVVLDGDSRRATLRVTNPTSATFEELRLDSVDSDDAFLVVAPLPRDPGLPG